MATSVPYQAGERRNGSRRLRSGRRIVELLAESTNTDQVTTAGTLEGRGDYSSATKLNGEPPIYLFDDFLTDVEIEALLAAGKTNLTRGLVTGDQGSTESDGRTGSTSWVQHDHTPAINGLATRISAIVGLPLENAEPFQIVYYGQHQQYAPHHDGWQQNTERGKRHLARGGQRVLTCLFYLDDVPRGGGTCFPRLDLEVRALRGRMVLFHNCEVGTSTRHKDSLHGGLPVEQGEKWAANLWFREGRFRSTNPRSGQFSRVV